MKHLSMSAAPGSAFLGRLFSIALLTSLLASPGVRADTADREALRKEIGRTTQIALAELRASAQVQLAGSLRANQRQYLADARDQLEGGEVQSDTMAMASTQ